jgi:hypothetical protein
MLDRFFEIANPRVRATTIREIGRVFEATVPEGDDNGLFERVMKLWDRRFANVEEKLDSPGQPRGEFEDELGQFLGWLKCDCFPFPWRYDRVTKVIRRLEATPGSYFVVETLEHLTQSGQHVDEAVKILHALIGKASQEFRWAYREEYLKLLLQRGFRSTNQETRNLSEAIQEVLLRDGHFQFLEIDPDGTQVADPKPPL